MTAPDTDAVMREAMAAHKAGRFTEAEVGYHRVLRSRPTDPKAFYYLGLLAFHRGETSTAIGHMRQCLSYAPNHPHAWNSLGALLMAAGETAEAKRAYIRVTETAPNMGEGWYNLGICLRNEGAFEEAVASLRTAIARQPDFERSYDALGMLLYQLERVQEAQEVYRNWASVDPANPIARHMAAATSQQQIPARASDEYVRKLFDDSARTFDVRLGELDYRAPGIVASALANVAGGNVLSAILDAGCGTGLCGPLVREHCKQLHGVDLSPQMIERARARECYDELVVGELSTFMRSRPEQFDAIVSADTLVYFGDLEEPLTAARQALQTGGVLIFTLEASSPHASTTDYRLETHGRYSHTDDYLKRSVKKSGFTLERLTPEVCRREAGKDVASFLLVARKA